jgi:hypothetical protein
MKRFLFLNLAIFTASIQTALAGTVYPISFSATTSDPTGNPAQSDTVTGNITTDGTIGTLAPSDILSWNLDLVDNLDAANDFNLTPSNSALVEDTGSALSATSSALSFNFSGSGEFLIQANSPGAFSGYHYFCLSTGGACLAGESIAPGYIYLDGVVLTGSAAPIGLQPLTPPSPNPAPEPSSYGLGITGLVALGLTLKRTFLK